MEILDIVAAAEKAGKISAESRINIDKWLTGPEYGAYHKQIQDLIEREEWALLDDSFYKIIEFGTGGRRGPRGVGPNRINHRTIGESAQGLSDYIHEIGNPDKGVVVAYDTRHGSREFSREICSIFAANGIPAYLYPAPRSTPQLSFSIRYLKTQAGCMISASHNPPSDNGIKVSWEDGGQVLPPHDKGIIQRVGKVGKIRKMPFDEAVAAGKIIMLDEKIDREYINRLKSLSLSSDRSAKIAYSPLHGVGATNVVALLNALEFDLETVPEQMKPDPEFSTVKNNLPNPELTAAMERVTELAANCGASVALASDPDADRLGAVIPCPKFASASGWMFLNGNQIGVLLLDHVLRRLEATGKMPENPVVIKTIVTTEMLDALCRPYGVEVIKNLLVGFKYIAEVTENLPADKEVIFTTEESHGYNRGTFVRDKDSAPAALHFSELASELKSRGETVYQHLNDLYRKHGYFCELTRSVYYKGKAGREVMENIMRKLRTHPPSEIDGRRVNRYIDRSVNKIFDARTGKVLDTIAQHTGNVMAFYFDESGLNRITARPSGTEPKIKFYAQLWEPIPEDTDDAALEKRKAETLRRAEKLIDALADPGD